MPSLQHIRLLKGAITHAYFLFFVSMLIPYLKDLCQSFLLPTHIYPCYMPLWHFILFINTKYPCHTYYVSISSTSENVQVHGHPFLTHAFQFMLMQEPGLLASCLCFLYVYFCLLVYISFMHAYEGSYPPFPWWIRY